MQFSQFAPAQGEGFEFTFRPGPIFSNIVVFDELNRANPRTQSALLLSTARRLSSDETLKKRCSTFVAVAFGRATSKCRCWAMAGR